MRLLMLCVVFSLNLFAADPFVGTWKLDLSKSKLRQPSNFSQGLTIKIEAVGKDTYRTTFDRQPAAAQQKGVDGTVSTVTYDGKPHPSAEPGMTQEFERIS